MRTIRKCCRDRSKCVRIRVHTLCAEDICVVTSRATCINGTGHRYHVVESLLCGDGLKILSIASAAHAVARGRAGLCGISENPLIALRMGYCYSRHRRRCISQLNGRRHRRGNGGNRKRWMRWREGRRTGSVVARTNTLRRNRDVLCVASSQVLTWIRWEVTVMTDDKNTFIRIIRVRHEGLIRKGRRSVGKRKNVDTTVAKTRHSSRSGGGTEQKRCRNGVR